MSKTRKIILIIQANEGLAEFNHPIMAKRTTEYKIFCIIGVGREKEYIKRYSREKRAILKYPFNKLN